MASILEDNGIDPRVVCDLISYPETTAYESGMLDLVNGKSDHFPSKDYIHQIIHGPVDCDQMDYLMRDSHYTGVEMGHIDLPRLLATMKVVNDRLCISRSGSPAAEGLMVSRSLMYTSVYFHPTVRILNRMITKSVLCSGLDLNDLYLWDDADLTQKLFDAGGASSKLARLVQNRMFYKKALILTGNDMDEDLAMSLIQYASAEKRTVLEQKIADKAGVDVADVCIEMPPPSNLKSTMKIGKTDVSIAYEDGRVKSLTRASSIAKALQSRDSFGWSLVVACPQNCQEEVTKATNRLFGL